MSEFTDDQIRAALAALGIAIPDDLPGLDDDQLRSNALLLLLNSEVSNAVYVRANELFNADAPEAVLGPFQDAANAGSPGTVQRAALRNLGILVDQTYALATWGAGGPALSDPQGYYDAYAQTALHCALLAQTLIDKLGPAWPDKELTDPALISHHLGEVHKAVTTVLADYDREIDRRKRRAQDPNRRGGTRWYPSWTQQPVLVLPEAVGAEPAQIRQLITDETERVLGWAKADPAIVDLTVTVVKIRGQFMAVVDGSGTWQCCFFAEKGRGLAAGKAAIDNATDQHWDGHTAMWVAAGGEADLLHLLPAKAIAPDAYPEP
jgi:hypothetical protein